MEKLELITIWIQDTLYELLIHPTTPETTIPNSNEHYVVSISPST